MAELNEVVVAAPLQRVLPAAFVDEALRAPPVGGEPEGSFGGDGLTVDAEGRLYVTGGAGVYVFDKAGTQLGVIPTPRRSITLAFAGPDRKTLYIGTLGANTPTGENWTTPQGVRNIAATIYAVDTLAAGVRK